MKRKEYTEEELKQMRCKVCSRRLHCVNKDTGIAVSDKTCFEEAICASCSFWYYCASGERDKKITPTFPIETPPRCFVEPTCEECRINSHCKNRGLKGSSFSWDPSLQTKPACFSGFHSVR